MAYTINANAKNVWIRDNEDTRDLSIQTDASSVYLDNGRTLEQELGEGSMVSNVATVDSAMSKIIDGTLDGAYESGVMYGRSLVNNNNNKFKEIAFNATNTTQATNYALLLDDRAGCPDLNITMVAGKKYLILEKWTISSTTGNGHTIQPKIIDKNGDVAYFSGDGQVKGIGTFTLKRTFIPTVDVDKFYFAITNGAGVTVSGTFHYGMIIEYQQGMENWDIPFFEGLCDVKMPILRNVGKNLFDINGKIDPYHQNNYSVRDGVLNVKGTWYVKQTLPLKPNTKYVARLNVKGISGSGWKWGIYCNGTDEYVTSGGTGKWTFTTPSTFSDISILFYSGMGQEGEAEFSNIQIEESPIATSYEDYKTNILRTSEEIVLREVGGVCDTYNPLTGEYVRRIGEVVLDGSEDWTIHNNSNSNRIVFKTSSKLSGYNTTTSIADKIRTSKITSGISDLFGYSFLRIGEDTAAPTAGVFLHLEGELTSMSNVTKLTEWLQANPITVQYELAEPITTIVTLTQSESIVKIGTELPNGVCDTYNLLTGEYIQRVGKVVLDGSEVWKRDVSSTKPADLERFATSRPDMVDSPYNTGNLVVSPSSYHIKNNDSTPRQLPNVWNYYQANIYMDFATNAFGMTVSDTADAKITKLNSYLQSNPVTVWYELKNPIVTKKKGLPNTYGVTLPNEVVDKYNESTGVYTQNIGRVVLDGTENWILGLPETTNNITFAHDITWGKVGHCVSSDRFETQYISSTNSTPIEDKESILCGNRFSSVAGRINITIAKSKLSAPTIEGFRQWLSQNPTTVYHELATPVEVPIYRINVGKTLPNGVCDTYNPVTKEYIQNIKKTVLNGDDSVTYLWETFDNPAENTVAISITNLSDVVNGFGQITSDKIPFGTSSRDNVESILYNHNNRKITIEILKSRLTELNLAGFKKWLQKNPLTVWYQLATPVTSKVDINMETLYVGHPIAYENGHVILESGHDGQSLLPTLEYSTVTNRVKQIESIGEQVLRQEKQLTMLEQMLIQNIIGLDYNNTVLALNLEINEVI